MATERIEIQRGVPYSGAMTITDEDGAAYDLTGKTVMFTVKEEDDVADNDDDAIITKNITVHTHADAGETVLELTAEETLVPLGDYKYDIRIYEAAPAVLLNSESGVCSVVDIVTKRTT